MIDVEVARLLAEAGLEWSPASGDRFVIPRLDDGQVFTVSDMTIEAHDFSTGTILGFNGTTEWALDSVAVEQTLWMPREDQLRGALGPALQCLCRVEDRWRVTTRDAAGHAQTFEAHEAADAYAWALLARLRGARTAAAS